MEKRYIAPSVKKAFEILRVISLSRGGMGVSELARDLKMAKSTVHGITSALEGIGSHHKDSAHDEIQSRTHPAGTRTAGFFPD